MWSCKKGHKVSIPLCVPCTINVLNLGGAPLIHGVALSPTGKVFADGEEVGILKSFEGFSCLADGKPLTPGTNPPCPKCGNPIFWVEPTPKKKPKAKAKVVAMAGPTSQDMKAAAYIHTYMESHGYPPTIREIMVACKYPSSSSAFRGRERLVASGLIKVVKGAARGIRSVNTLTAIAAKDMSDPFKPPLFLFKKVMETWQAAVKSGEVDPTKHGGGVCMIVPKKGCKPGEGSNQILWFKDASMALASKKSMVD